MCGEMGQRVKQRKKLMCGKRLEYLPEEMLGGKDPPPATGCEARMPFKNPALRNLERDFTPMVGKDPFKEIEMVINQRACSLADKVKRKNNQISAEFTVVSWEQIS